MRELILVNQSRARMPRRFLDQWLKSVIRQLPEVHRRRVRAFEMTIAFLEVGPSRELNRRYRRRDYATDVLSFEGEGESLGELVICPAVVQRQAKEHGHSFRTELAYMVLHGLLHLLGFDHERGGAEARRMFRLQDKIFRRLT